MRTRLLLGVRPAGSSPSGLSNIPAATKIMGAVTAVPEIFRETMPKTKSNTAKAMTKFAISDVMEIPFVSGCSHCCVVYRFSSSISIL
ncbi:hypothetical protein MSHOH_1656 [Methanosarcina horonobensis HB-1 = JCM 15518]|uniref:Uncharacterized protein n=1 Tax=Methanosarcina horonobensis HB-1 = JCM 15518 TaxID=1434110 RepID=A0A0E3S999_9EURY|nr:hypothetical protein [Methanosarcina horonobensis]AKB78139.1 hypothetical protein MSHOH_1656 [Methanosarcina horonobensis HB-1 = JCM 15518]